MRLYIKVKFRAFGVTFGTVEREADVTENLCRLILSSIKGVPRPVESLLQESGTWGISGAYVRLDRPIVLMDDRGVYVEIR